MPDQPSDRARRLDRREFLLRASRTGLGLAVAGGASSLLAACGADEPAVAPTAAGTTGPRGSAIVGDVVDFALESDDWEGAFGFVTLRLHRGRFEGGDLLFIRTDASDAELAEREGLVHVPKIGTLARPGLSHAMYVFDGSGDEHPPVLATAPGQDGYTPAWRLHRVRFAGAPRRLGSAREVRGAADSGEVEIEETDVVLNAAVVSWPGGALPVDRELTAYLGEGPLIEGPDGKAMTVTFKLNQCYPGSWYIVTEHSIAPAAEMTHTVFAPGLQAEPSSAGATGRTNVFMNGIEGPGPMGFQPSAFDFAAGAEEWSPYWDHYTYAWRDGATPRVLTSQREVHAARDAGELEEFPGTPDTDGRVFTVNCPVPVLGPGTFTA